MFFLDITQKSIRKISFSISFPLSTNCCSLLPGWWDGCKGFWQCDQNLDLPIEDPTFEESNCRNHSLGLLIHSLSRLIQDCCTEKLVKLMEQCRHFQGQNTSKTRCKWSNISSNCLFDLYCSICLNLLIQQNPHLQISYLHPKLSQVNDCITKMVHFRP